MDGYRRYRASQSGQRGRLEQLAELGQAPLALVVTCCDARLLPQEIFDAEPGALFIVRNVANLVPPYEIGGGFHGTSAAVEFAVKASAISSGVRVSSASSCPKAGVRASISKRAITRSTPRDLICPKFI
jgi:carbonic anhydrase